MIPYDPPMITCCLRTMSPERLASIHPHDFQYSPIQFVTPGKLIRELISNEKARRTRNG